jgi:hypothetical protein
MTVIERALQLIPNHSLVGIGSGRAAQAFVRGLGEQVRTGQLQVRGVPTSQESADLAQAVGVPLITLAEAGMLDITVDGADEVDPNLDLIKRKSSLIPHATSSSWSARRSWCRGLGRAAGCPWKCCRSPCHFVNRACAISGANLCYGPTPVAS